MKVRFNLSYQNLFYIVVLLTSNVTLSQDLLAIKTKVIEKCEETKDALNALQPEQRQEFIRYLAKVVNFRIEEDQVLNQYFSIIPEVSNELGKSDISKGDFIKKDKSLNIFQRDEKVRTLEPEKESKARRCALDLLEYMAPESFIVIRELFDIYQKAPTVPNDPAFNEFLHKKIINIIIKSITDNRVVLSEVELNEFVNYYLNTNSIEIKYCILAILQQRHSLVINQLLLNYQSNQDLKYLTLIDKITSDHESKVIFELLYQKYSSGNNLEANIIENLKTIILKLFKVLDEDFYKTFTLPVQLQNDVLLKNQLAESLINKYENKLDIEKYSSEIVEMLFKLYASENNYQGFFTDIEGNSLSKPSSELVHKLLLNEIYEIKINDKLTERKQDFIKTIFKLPQTPNVLYKDFLNLITCEETSEKLFIVHEILNSNELLDQNNKIINRFDLLKQQIEVIKRENGLLINDSKKKLDKKAEKQKKSVIKEEKLADYFGHLLKDQLNEQDNSVMDSIMNRILELENYKLYFSTLKQFNNYKNYLENSLTRVNYKKLSKEDFNIIAELLKNSLKDKEYETKIYRLLINNQNIFSFRDKLIGKIPTEYNKTFLIVDKFYKGEKLSQENIKLMLYESQLVSCKLKLPLILHNFQLLTDELAELQLASCLKEFELTELKSNSKELNKFSYNIEFVKDYFESLTKKEIKILLKNLEIIYKCYPKAIQFNTLDKTRLFKRILFFKDNRLINKFINIFSNDSEQNVGIFKENLFVQTLQDSLSVETNPSLLKLNLCRLLQSDSADKSICKEIVASLFSEVGSNPPVEDLIFKNDFYEVIANFEIAVRSEMFEILLKNASTTNRMNILKYLVDSNIILTTNFIQNYIYDNNSFISELALVYVLKNDLNNLHMKEISYSLLAGSIELFCKDKGMRYFEEDRNLLEIVVSQFNQTGLEVAKICAIQELGTP